MSAPVGIALARLRPPFGDRVVDGLHALERAVEARPWSRASLADELVAAGRAWFVAEADGHVVGLAGSARLGDDVHVLRLAVAGAHRRRGIGGDLLDALVAQARDERAESITLEVRVGNAAARALYLGRGFTERGHRPGYYADGEDALLLTLGLAGPSERAHAREGD